MSTPPTPPAQSDPRPDASTPSASPMPTDRPETDPFAFASNSPNQSQPAPANPGQARPSFDTSGQTPPKPANPSQAAPSPGGPSQQPPMPGVSGPSERFWPDAPNQIGGGGAQGWGGQTNQFAQGGASDPYGVPGPQAPYRDLPIPPPMQRPVARTKPVTRAAAAVVPLGIGAAVAIGLGVYGRVHNPTGVAIDVAGFSSTQAVKTWLATVAIVLAIVQLISAFAVYGKIPGPSWSGTLHKWSGRLAVLFTLPVVAHCLYALGFQYDTGRVLIHSVLGCFFFGAFAAKMLVLSRDDAPRGLLPVIGGLVFSALVGIWLTSALWFFTTVGFTF